MYTLTKIDLFLREKEIENYILLYIFSFNFKVKTQLFKYKIIIIVISNYKLLF